ncbi:hypothetical protein [Desulfuromonas thiophila]|uniref:Lipase (Class 3) n=1 Tax=Desulfuromonas thiophila TaxID=57664 RepID=A0A1G7DQC8_9BACT|nr:hypothetical protein [Desulfuromonas thiophila]SDE53697.1 hypothetical protein SAMN05661003_1159 [Desulfuromonas thiophila]
MSDVKKYYDLATLAEASYILFDKLNNVYSDEKVRLALQNTDVNHGSFSATQAADFVDHWQVISHQKNTPESGFSATLFRNKDTNEYIYACRGTEGAFSDDLWSADYGDIVTDGLAIKQIVDMYNDWIRLHTANKGVYQAAYLERQEAESDNLRGLSGQALIDYLEELRSRSDIVIDEPGGVVYRIQFADSTTVFNDERAQGLGKLTGSESLSVTGHSLGGHLAAAFTRLFPGLGAEAITINGAGFATGLTPGLSGNAQLNIANLFGILEGNEDFDASKIQNLYGSAGPEFVTMDNYLGLVQQGAHDEVFIERWGPSQTFGHGKGQMTDSLAVFDLFSQVDASLTLSTITSLLEISANKADHTLESAVSALGKLFVTGFNPRGWRSAA